jgi:hypothetical protein
MYEVYPNDPTPASISGMASIQLQTVSTPAKVTIDFADVGLIQLTP